MTRQLLWLRNDLRIHDNSALGAAAQRGPVIALYLLSPGQWRAHDDAPCKVDFWLRNLRVLRRDLERLGIPLLIRTAERWEQAPRVIAEVCREQRIRAVHANEEYGIHETCRNRSVKAALDALDVPFHTYTDQLLFAPGSILNKSGGYFQVFSQFRKVCYQRLGVSLPHLVPPPRPQAPLPLASDPLPTQVDGFAEPSSELRELWPAGEEQARRQLENFAEEGLLHYAELRDCPSREGTSRLSAYLAAGVLSPRQCLHAALANNRGEFETGHGGAIAWIDELLWRDFYKHILVGYPQVSRHRAFREHTEALPWRDAPADLEAWQQGRTGFPLVDAAMRQLSATGWMHNRLRMLTAMFLSKNLLIDWREGERWFMRHLIDGDLAANNGGWQWSASTGTDAVPYFRLFNPLAQSRRFDPHGRFIRSWLPELADCEDDSIHAPHDQGLFAPQDYPPPIVDLAFSRERALRAFKDLRSPI
ncbi:Deoxyribodipyrimidine photo-lyase [compost metagenome]